MSLQVNSACSEDVAPSRSPNKCEPDHAIIVAWVTDLPPAARSHHPGRARVALRKIQQIFRICIYPSKPPSTGSDIPRIMQSSRLIGNHTEAPRRIGPMLRRNFREAAGAQYLSSNTAMRKHFSEMLWQQEYWRCDDARYPTRDARRQFARNLVGHPIRRRSYFSEAGRKAHWFQINTGPTHYNTLSLSQTDTNIGSTQCPPDARGQHEFKRMVKEWHIRS